MTSEPQTPSSSGNIEEVRALRRLDYETASAEYESVLREYRTQSNLLNLYLTVFTGMLVFAFSRSEGESNALFLQKIQEGPQFLLPLLLASSASILFYFHSLAVDIIYNLWLVEARRAAIELAVNRDLGQSVLCWDSKVVQYFNERFVHHRSWINPSWITAAWSIAILGVLAAVHMYLAFVLTQFPAFQITFAVLVALSFGYSASQYYLMQTSGKQFIVQRVLSEYGVSTQNLSPTRADSAFIGFATVVLGWFAFVLASVQTRAFAPPSDVDLPLVYIFTVVVGDLLFLPAINAMAFDLRYNSGPAERQVLRGSTPRFSLLFAVLISTLVAALSHYEWATDQWTDFISTVTGRLTFGGWWHLLFSVVEGTIVVRLAQSLLRASRGGSDALYKKVRRVWIIVLLFASLMICNWVFQWLTLFPEASAFTVARKALLAGSFPLATLLILSFAKSRRRRAARAARD